MNRFDRLLIVEDTKSLSRTYSAHLADLFASVEIAETGAQAQAAIDAHPPSCVLLDLKLPDADGLDLLQDWIGAHIPAPVIVITANGSMAVAVDAMRRGAVDFVVKPTGRERLRATVKNAVETFRLKKTVETYEARTDRKAFCDFVGQSLAMQGVYQTIETAAPSKASVFVTGETGTGKELVARAIHALSPRSQNSFVAINCGAIPKDLIESEVFGHVKGAFTGATSDRIGAAQMSDGGTLFLDELGEMPIELQPKLLRFLQTGEFARVGETRTRRADIRIIAATNRAPLQAVRDGVLREDLYYRLHVIPVALPPLRDRGSDILLLAEEFLDRFAHEEGKSFTGFDAQAEAWLVSNPWPGNVRQLENLMRQVAVLHAGGEVSIEMLPVLDQVRTRVPSDVGAEIQGQAGHDACGADPGRPGIEPLWLTEKKAIEQAIALCRGNISVAAGLLEINPSTIYRKKAAWDQQAGVARRDRLG